MKGKSFRFYYLIVLSFLVLSMIFLLGFAVFSENYGVFGKVIAADESSSGKTRLTIALADDWGRPVYKEIEVRIGDGERIRYILEALFSYPSDDPEAKNYIDPNTKLLDFRKEGGHVYVSLTNDFKSNQGSRLSISYSQLKNTLKLEYPDMDNCTIIYSDSAISI